MERVSVEVWQQILLKVMETNADDWPIFATSCTPYTFLAFTYLHLSHQRDQKPYLDYLTQRTCLRLVCRAWNEFVLVTIGHRWLPLEDWSPMYELDPTSLIRTKGGVGPIKILSMDICRNELLTPILSWASHILKRPASQSPLQAYILHLDCMLRQGRNPLDLLVRTTTTQDPEYTNTNTTLHLLSIISTWKSSISISFSQISRTFTGLRSLFLIGITAAPQQTLTLAHLEVLYLEFRRSKWEEVQQSIETWDTPALRHVRLAGLSTPLTNVIDRFLGRYAHQIESLVLSEWDTWLWPFLLDISSRFWAQFTALRLLGLNDSTLKNERWSGWSIVPPPTHPCRYLLCRFDIPGQNELAEVARVVGDIRARWTWNDDVRLVVGYGCASQYYVVKNIRGDTSIANMERNVRILPEL